MSELCLDFYSFEYFFFKYTVGDVPIALAGIDLVDVNNIIDIN